MSAARGITAIPGIRVGHATDPEALTGCTVVLCPDGAVPGVEVRGGAPATRETDLLRPEMMVPAVHAVLLAGGSAFGLAAADGVLRYLEERGVGFDVGVARIPIVPAAALFDLWTGRADVRPGPEMGYRACVEATDGPVEEGAVGAGTGATVGKILGPRATMRGGVGTALVEAAGVRVGAIAAVNAVGDVRDERGEIIAGARDASGAFLDTARALIEGRATLPLDSPGQHTTLAVIATDAVLTKAEATRIAHFAHDGLARVISPAHTMLDGDTVFVLSVGTASADLTTIGVAAADAVASAIVRAVRISNGLAPPAR